MSYFFVMLAIVASCFIGTALIMYISENRRMVALLKKVGLNAFNDEYQEKNRRIYKIATALLIIGLGLFIVLLCVYYFN